MVDIWFFSVWFFSAVQVGFSFVKVTTKLFSPHPVRYWVVSDMRDTFSFFFLWLEVWCISFFYKQSVAFIIRRLYIIIEALLDLNEFENHVNICYVFLEGKWKFSKTVSIKKNRIHFSWPHYDQMKISSVTFCSYFEAGWLLETLTSRCGCREEFTILMLSALYKFY